MNIARSLNESIVFLLEKICQIQRSMVFEFIKDKGISSFQFSLLEFLSRSDQKLRTVSNLAKEFDLTKATISDSITNLHNKGFIEKIADTEDRRIQYIQLTSKTKEILESIVEKNNLFITELNEISETEKKSTALFLTQMIKSLYEKKFLSTFKVCLTCSNYQPNQQAGTDKPHYCKFLKTYQNDMELELNCNYYREAVSQSSTIL